MRYKSAGGLGALYTLFSVYLYIAGARYFLENEFITYQLTKTNNKSHFSFAITTYQQLFFNEEHLTYEKITFRVLQFTSR